MTLAQQKKYILAEIDKALKTAPTEAEVPRPLKERVIIRIPGTTACYRIYNTQEALSAAATQARKGLNKQWYKPVGTTPGIRASTPKAKPLSGIIEGTYEGALYHYDGGILLFTTPVIKLKGPVVGWLDIKNSTIDRIINLGSEDVIGVEYLTEGECKGITQTPCALTNMVRLISHSRKAYMPLSCYLYIQQHYPKATFNITEGEEPILIFNDGLPAGFIGRMNPATEDRLERVYKEAIA